MKGYRGPGGKIFFSSKEGYYDMHLEVSCGQCIGCRLERSRQWAIRIMHEAETHTRNSFLTLTYDESHLPTDKGLNPDDITLFFKRLRKSRGKVRYYQCGEYGERTFRPHHHVALFGEDFSDDREVYKETDHGTYWTSPSLDALWGQGHAIVGELSFESAAYVARYITGKISGPQAEDHYKGRKPEYSTMSRRPGIGASWFAKYGDQVYPRDEVVARGFPSQPPKFYDRIFEIENADALEKLKRARAKKARKHLADTTPDRLAVREKVKTLNKAAFKREPGDHT